MPHITHPTQMTINLQAPYCASDELVSTCLPVSVFPSNTHEKVQSARGLASVKSTDSLPLHKHRDGHLYVAHCRYCSFADLNVISYVYIGYFTMPGLYDCKHDFKLRMIYIEKFHF